MIQINKINGRIEIDGIGLDKINISELEQKKAEALADYMRATRELELIRGVKRIDWMGFIKWLVVGLIVLIGLVLLVFQGLDVISTVLVLATLGIFWYNLAQE